MGKRIYKYNKNYFHKINTINKAYWLGFILADGYIMNTRKKNNSGAVGLRLRLSIKDKKHLKRFRNSLHSDIPIKKVKNYGIYENQKDLSQFVVYSRQIVNDLRYHLKLKSTNKSCLEVMPNLSDKNLIKNFILGLFDGDGSISYYYETYENGRKGLRVEWQIVSSKEILEDIEKFLRTELDIKFQKISKNNSKKDNNLYRLRTGNRKYIEKLYSYFYLDNNNKKYLRRKETIFKEIVNELV